MNSTPEPTSFFAKPLEILKVFSGISRFHGILYYRMVHEKNISLESLAFIQEVRSRRTPITEEQMSRLCIILALPHPTVRQGEMGPRFEAYLDSWDARRSFPRG
jgi:hypothetical protein